MSSLMILSPAHSEPSPLPLSFSFPPMPSPPAEGADQPPDDQLAGDDAPPSSPSPSESPPQSPPPLTSTPSLPSPPLISVALVPQVHCLWSSRYSTIMPAALIDSLLPSEFSASIRRINSVVGCPSWAVTVYILCACFTLSGIIMVVIGAHTTAESESDSSGGSSTVTTPQPQGNVTAPVGSSPPWADAARPFRRHQHSAVGGSGLPHRRRPA